MGASVDLTGVEDDVMVAGVCDDERHEVCLDEVVLPEEVEGLAGARVVPTQEPLQVLEAVWKGRGGGGGRKG